MVPKSALMHNVSMGSYASSSCHLREQLCREHAYQPHVKQKLDFLINVVTDDVFWIIRRVVPDDAHPRIRLFRGSLYPDVGIPTIA
jgi:hypothetical protein